MEFRDVINLRQSVRAYLPEQITEEQLNAVLEAAYNAPVAMGVCEKVHLTVVQDPEVLAKLNGIFAGIIGKPEAVATYGAPTVIFVSCPTADEEILIGANAAVLVENMLLAAVDQGLAGVYLFGISQATQGRPEVRELLQLPEGYRTVSGIAFGTPAEKPQPRQVGARYATDYIR